MGGALPGLALIVAIALVARVSARYTGPIPDVVIALALGVVLRNAVSLPASIAPGIKAALFYGLRTAIILLGAALSVQAVIRTGGATLILVVTLVATAMGLGIGAARLFKLKSPIGTLIGAGTAICGASAILTVGPLTRATEEEIAYAISTIFTFNILALIVYPPIGHALGMTSAAFGSWTGTAVNDTSVVVATGYIYGHAAGAVATIVKLTRTVLLVPLAVMVGAAYEAKFHKLEGNDAVVSVWTRARKAMPWFVLGFLAMAGLNSLGVISAPLGHVLGLIASFLIVMVLAGVGLGVDVRALSKMGAKPFAVGFALATIMSVCSLGLVYALGL